MNDLHIEQNNELLAKVFHHVDELKYLFAELWSTIYTYQELLEL
jgi:hypothetical protein